MILTAAAPVVNPTPAADPFAPFDGERWELGPDEADRTWAAEHQADPADWHDADGPEPDWDGMAGDAEAVARHEAGWC